jgi:UDP-glucose 4-epimerase
MKRIFSFILAVVFAFEGLTLDAAEDKYILVTGGAGFIGSHVNEMLYENGYKTIVLDNLVSGNQKTLMHGTFVEGDISDPEVLDQIFTTYPIEAVMHFAAYIEVGESVTDPLKYYRNNVCGTLALLEAMQRHHVNVIVFSSSAAIFGMPSVDQIVEESPHQPINPYGQTKLMIEKILQDMDKAYGLRYSCLRYFNVAGGDPAGRLKNYQKKAMNLIPIVLRALQKPDSVVTIFGTDYPTHDGTCIRDYIHVYDLASAHIASLEKLLSGGASHAYNLGNGRGYSVREVLAAVEKVTGFKVPVKEGVRRAGDPAILIANPEKAFQELGWIPQYPSIEAMVEHAWIALQKDEAALLQAAGF